MKTCPNCGELLGDSVNVCFSCKYNFQLRRVIMNEEEKRGLQQRKNEKEECKKNQLSKNPLYEYQVVIVNNLETGEVNLEEMQQTLNYWSEAGWKLHSVFNNELGKTSSTIHLGFLGTNVNATIDQTVMIFERCIKGES